MSSCRMINLVQTLIMISNLQYFVTIRAFIRFASSVLILSLFSISKEKKLPHFSVNVDDKLSICPISLLAKVPLRNRPQNSNPDDFKAGLRCQVWLNLAAFLIKLPSTSFQFSFLVFDHVPRFCPGYPKFQVIISGGYCYVSFSPF